MAFIVKNMNASLRFCLTVLKMTGFLVPELEEDNRRKIANIYGFIWFMFLAGTPIIAQTGAIFQIWGDITLMTSASFLLFTNLAFASKMINVMLQRRKIQAIIDEADDELRNEEREAGVEIVKSSDGGTTKSFSVLAWLSAVTVFGWAASAEKNQLPLQAWYPYNSLKSPAYELTYALQCSSLILSALVNICFDALVTSSVAVCRCRLRLIGLSLRTLCDNMTAPENQMLGAEEEELVRSRLVECVKGHEASLSSASRIQSCFTIPILAQFTVSIVIICVTAYQLALELHNKNFVRIISMTAYLWCMTLQVFVYCYRAHQLTEESSEICDAAYSCPWYVCSTRVRRVLLIVMQRTRSEPKLSAGGFTVLSLNCFTSIIKASYTFFTVLQQAEDRNK